MTTPPAGISDVDWLATPPSVRALVMAQQEQIQLLQQQLTALATELASLRERIGRNSRNSSRPPSSDGPGLSRPPAAKVVAASVVGSRGIPEQGRNCCRSSALTRWSSTTLTPAATAAPFCRVRIRSHCAIR